jgi:hypothetical protein
MQFCLNVLEEPAISIFYSEHTSAAVLLTMTAVRTLIQEEQSMI